MTGVQTCALPIYALVVRANLQPGERVLIHSAAGGVGLAALHIAKRCGAQIFATAGSEQKRDYLLSLGVHAVADSHDEQFAATLLTASDGQGMDVILNSLTGRRHLTNPLFIKPVARRLGVAVKPELRPGDRAARHSLLYEGARHKGDLIEEDSRQSNALNKGVAGFVSASEEVVGIRAIAASDNHFILAAALGNLEHTLKPCGNMYDNVTPKRFNRAAADSEVLFIEAAHAPQDKAVRHGNGLAGTDGAVTDDAVSILMFRFRPPEEGRILPRTEALVLHSGQPPFQQHESPQRSWSPSRRTT